MEIGERLLRLIEASGKKKKVVANDLGITPATLSNYLHDKRTPSSDLVITMAKYFNVTTDYLYGINDNKVSEPMAYTAKEKQVLNAYRNMPEPVRDLFKNYIENDGE